MEAEANEPHVWGHSAGNRRAHDSSKKPATANQSVNGNISASAELTQEKNAAADVTEDLEKASLDDKA